jgi:hypothetical protein
MAESENSSVVKTAASIAEPVWGPAADCEVKKQVLLVPGSPERAAKNKQKRTKATKH